MVANSNVVREQLAGQCQDVPDKHSASHNACQDYLSGCHRIFTPGNLSIYFWEQKPNFPIDFRSKPADELLISKEGREEPVIMVLDTLV